MTALDDIPVIAAPGRTAEVVRAEKTVLASMIASAAVAEEALDLLGPDDCMGEPEHRAVFAATRWLAEEAPVPGRGTLKGAPGGDTGVQRRFTAVLGRLMAAEQGVWRTSQAAVILGDLAGYAAPGWRADAAEVLRAATQRRTFAAADAIRRAAAEPGFDGAEHGDMLRKLLDSALGGAVLDAGAVTAADLFLETLERMESAEPPGVIQFPWADLREIVPWLRPGQLVTIAARPSVGKSLTACDLVRHTGIKMRLPVVLFTMEMGRDEVMDRLVSAEAGVAHDRIVACDLNDLAWDRITAAQERFAESKILIDDTPKVTLAHIRARLRGMARTEPAQLAVVDYLQLMQAGQGENRQQEVSALVSGLKAVAREFRIPVVMLCQLNRGPEHRQDRRPQPSDARESGCMPASTRLLRADNGQEVTLGELVLSQEQPLVLAVDERQRLVASQLVKTFPSGIKPVYRLRLASGRTADATANHQFLTVNGWERLDALAKGSFVATPRVIPQPLNPEPANEDELILMAHLIGDGSTVGPGFKYTTADPANKAAVTDTAARLFDIQANAKRPHGVWQMWFPSPYRLTHNRRHPMTNWLEPLGLVGRHSWDKFIPEALFGLPNAQIALFLRHLWATDGSITKRLGGHGGHMSIYYATTSRRLADNVQHALLRFGILSCIRPSRKTGYRICWHVVVQGATSQMTFLERIGCHGARGDVVPEALEILSRLKVNPNADLVPQPVAILIKEALRECGMSHRALADALGERYCGSYLLGHPGKPRRFSRPRLARMAEITGSSELSDIARSDLYWDEVAEITPLGEMPTFDATVEGTHNFIANGIVAHNSIENDSDILIMIHREDMYDLESPKAGQADMIVGKQRGGRRGTATVGFQGNYARFVDLAWSPYRAAEAASGGPS